MSEGKTKSLTIGKIKNGNPRRIDFLYSNPKEYPYAVLYFTGSKAFNASMRGYAQSRNLRLNEHGLRRLVNNKPESEYLELPIETEKDIFNYLQLMYVEPIKRIDFRSLKQDKTINSKMNETNNIVENMKHTTTENINRNTLKNKNVNSIKQNKSYTVKNFKNAIQGNHNNKNNTNTNNNKLIIKQMINNMKNKINANA